MKVRIVALGVCWLLAGCSPISDGWRARVANDRIMLIEGEPPTLGQHRLDDHVRNYPDVGVFLSLAGRPDFIAEMTNEDRHYLILYYLKNRQAYACRTEIRNRHEVEFAGPYPITPREFEILTGFRKQARRSAPDRG